MQTKERVPAEGTQRSIFIRYGKRTKEVRETAAVAVEAAKYNIKACTLLA